MSEHAFTAKGNATPATSCNCTGACRPVGQGGTGRCPSASWAADANAASLAALAEKAAPVASSLADVAMQGSSVQAPLVEQIAEVLAEHHLSAGGRNLGQYRTEWTCDCGDTWVTDGHKAESCKSGNDAHLASQLARLVEREKHGAWSEAVHAVRTAFYESDGDADFALHTGDTANPYANGDE